MPLFGRLSFLLFRGAKRAIEYACTEEGRLKQIEEALEE